MCLGIELKIAPNGKITNEEVSTAEMDDSYRIQISSNLVDKLVRGGDKQKKKAKKLKPKIPQEKKQHKHQNEPNRAPAAPAPKITPNEARPVQPPVFSPIAPPPASAAVTEFEAIRSFLQESQGVMKKLEQQEANMTGVLNQKAKELREKEFKLPYNNKSMPCLAEIDSCRDCYKEQQHEKKQPLKCAGVVKSYKDCVFQARQQQQVSSAT